MDVIDRRSIGQRITLFDGPNSEVDNLFLEIKLRHLRHSAAPCSNFYGSIHPRHLFSIPYSVNGYVISA